MAGRQTIKGQVAVEYLKKYPNLPILTIAKKLHKDQPKLFPAVESTRTILREYAGKIGNEKAPTGGGRRTNPDKYGTRRPKGVSGEDPWRLMMPENKSVFLEPWILPTAVRRVGILSDIHIPFACTKALTAAIECLIEQKIETLILNGDFMDMATASFHERDPRDRDMAAEIEAGRQLMAMLRSAFPGIPIIARAANHERRLERYLMRNAEILLGMPEFELKNLLRLAEHGIEYVEPDRPMYLGKLTLLHGDEYKGSGGVNPARWLSLRTGASAAVGHFHRVSSHIDRTVRNDTRGWWSIGCLCSLEAQWLPYNQWSQGFAIVHVNSDGSFEFDNKMIVDGKVR